MVFKAINKFFLNLENGRNHAIGLLTPESNPKLIT